MFRCCLLRHFCDITNNKTALPFRCLVSREDITLVCFIAKVHSIANPVWAQEPIEP